MVGQVIGSAASPTTIVRSLATCGMLLRVRRPARFAAVALVALAACKPTPTTSYEPVASRAPIAHLAPDVPDGGTPSPTVAEAPDSGAPADAGPAPVEEPFLSVECADRITRRRTTVPSEACRFRGVVRSARPAVLPVGTDAFSPPLVRGPTRAIELSIEPDDTVPCSAPFDAPDPNIPGMKTKLDEAHRVVVLGGARLAQRIAEGARLCGWTHRVRRPGLYPAGWEGALADASGALLGAWSFYFDRAESPVLARAFRFSREGPARRIRIDEGGAFVDTSGPEADL